MNHRTTENNYKCRQYFLNNFSQILLIPMSIPLYTMCNKQMYKKGASR